MLKLKLLCVLALLVLPIVAVAQAQLTFQDGTFQLTNFDVVQNNYRASVDYGRVTTGGNPSAFLEVTISGPREDSNGRAYFFRRDAVFNPSAQGEIQSLDYSEDHISLNTGTMAFSLALKQDGNIYTATQTSGLGNGGTTSSITTWSRHNSTGILARNFALAYSAAPGAPRFPDFSSEGSPITFGFARTISAYTIFGYTNSSGIDNWRVVVNFIPVPTATGNIGGFILFQGISASAPQQTITFTLTSTGANPVTYTFPVLVAPNGVYQINDIPVGTYSMCIKGDKYLSRMVPVTVIGNSTVTVNISLKTGDANNDDFVDIRDLLVLIAAYNQAAPASGYNFAADFTFDGIVDIADLLLLIGNFNEQGECR